MKKLLFIPLIALATFSYAQECTAVTEINEDFSSFSGTTLPQNCWSTIVTESSRGYVAQNSHLQGYSFESPNVPIYFVTPEISEFNDKQKLSFDAFITSGSFPGASGSVQVGTLTIKDDVSTFVPITSEYELAAQANKVLYENVALGTSTTAKFIAFKFTPRSIHTALTLDNITFKEGSLGIDDLKVIQKPTLYPNPAVDVVNIKANSKVLSYEVYDLTGRKVAAGSNSEKVNVSNLSKGNYIINIVTKDGKTTNKFIKK